MDMWIVIFGLFACATVIAMILGYYLIRELEAFFPEEYRKAGSPSAFWNDGRKFSFLWYALKGGFVAVPDAKLVRAFKIYRCLEISRLALLALLPLAVSAHWLA